MTSKRIAAAFLAGMLIAQSPSSILADLLPALTLQLLGALAIPIACCFAYWRNGYGSVAARNATDDLHERPTIRMPPRASPLAAVQADPADTKSIYVLSRIRSG